LHDHDLRLGLNHHFTVRHADGIDGVLAILDQRGIPGNGPVAGAASRAAGLTRALAQAFVVNVELEEGDVVAGAGRDVDQPGNRRAAGRADDVDQCRDVVHDDPHRRAEGRLATRIGRPGVHHVLAIRQPGRVPAHRPAIRAVLVGAEVQNVRDGELHTHHVVVGVGAHRYGAAHRLAVRRVGDADYRRGVVVHRHLDAVLAGLATVVRRDGLARVWAI